MAKKKTNSRTCHKCRCREACGLLDAIECAIARYDVLAYNDETGNAAREVPGCKSQIYKAVAGACTCYVKER